MGALARRRDAARTGAVVAAVLQLRPDAPAAGRQGRRDRAVASNLGDAKRAEARLRSRSPTGCRGPHAKAIKLVSSVEHEARQLRTAAGAALHLPQDVQPYERLEVRITVEVADRPASRAGENRNANRRRRSAAAHRSIAAAEGRDEATPLRCPGGRTGAGTTKAAQRRTGWLAPVPADHHARFQPDARTRSRVEPAAPALLKNLHFDLPARPDRRPAGDPAVLEPGLLDAPDQGHEPLPRTRSSAPRW